MLTWITGLYLIPVVIATVYFGWHFIPDLLGGAVLAAMSVTIGHLTVYRRCDGGRERCRRAAVAR